ncbi:hypothetical protein FOXYSP1_19936 [Fusarium oxysporum f. sp. phaseoli]
MDQPKTSELNTDKNKHLLNRYGIVPSNREASSSLVRSSSNLDESADQCFTAEKKTGELKLTAHSHLQQETEAQQENEGRETKQEHNV